MSSNATGWIGVDLDGTLAKYDCWKGPTHIGDPVPLMLSRVKDWMSSGRIVKIFTARIAGGDQEVKDAIEYWLVKHLGRKLEITCSKDYAMVELWDDRAVQVVPNTGVRADGILDAPRPE